MNVEVKNACSFTSTITYFSIALCVTDEMGTNVGKRGIHIGYWWEIQKERDHWEDEDIGGWRILKWILER
jgi:hypothetical protein